MRSLLLICFGALLIDCTNSQSLHFGKDPSFDLRPMTRKGQDKVRFSSFSSTFFSFTRTLFFLNQDFSKSVALGGGIKFMYRMNIGENTVANCNGAHGAVRSFTFKHIR